MAKRRQIYFWHGRSKEIEDEVAKVCTHDPNNGEYYFDRSLDEFAEYFDNFMLVDGDTIAVTQHKRFNQMG